MAKKWKVGFYVGENISIVEGDIREPRQVQAGMKSEDGYEIEKVIVNSIGYYAKIKNIPKEVRISKVITNRKD